LAIRDGVELEVTQNGDVWAFDDEDAILPTKVRDWLGLYNHEGAWDEINDDYDEGSIDHSLADKNDSGATFDQIADIIEMAPKGLLV
jgi:hypothetical protein